MCFAYYYFFLQVTWLKREQNNSHIQLLTIGVHTYTFDKRFTVEFEYPNNWRLRIADTNKSDEGLYVISAFNTSKFHAAILLLKFIPFLFLFICNRNVKYQHIHHVPFEHNFMSNVSETIFIIFYADMQSILCEHNSI